MTPFTHASSRSLRPLTHFISSFSRSVLLSTSQTSSWRHESRWFTCKTLPHPDYSVGSTIVASQLFLRSQSLLQTSLDAWKRFQCLQTCPQKKSTPPSPPRSY